MVASLRACALDETSSRGGLRRLGLAYEMNALTEKLAG
jgi:hypothetical protein